MSESTVDAVVVTVAVALIAAMNVLLIYFLIRWLRK
jgi:hypothetical protein